MSSEVAIAVERLSKRYEIYDKPHDRLKQSLYPRAQRWLRMQPKQYFQEFWALRDVSFEIGKGETVGIIGRNGSGKSTLLQMICGTLDQTSGTVHTQGRIAALLELGSGFNPEFTGRENVYMNGAILGLAQEEIDLRFDEIAAFAGIGAFMEQPVKSYSSGMFVRLAFASNIMSNPEIMIVDEALAVGDMNFQAKCMTALTRIQEAGATILFVSHDVGTVKSLCSRCIYLDGGRAVAVGPSSSIAELYVRNMHEEINAEHRRLSTAQGTPAPAVRPSTRSNEHGGFQISDEFERRVAQFRYGSGEARTTAVELVDEHGAQVTCAEFDQSVRIRIHFEALASKTVSVNFGIYDDKKNNILGCGFAHVDQPYLAVTRMQQYVIEYSLRLPLQEGSYSLKTNISSVIVENESAEFIDVVPDAIVFQVARWRKARVWSKVQSFAALKVQRFDEQDAKAM